MGSAPLPLFHSFLLTSLRYVSTPVKHELAPPQSLVPHLLHSYSPGKEPPRGTTMFCFPDVIALETDKCPKFSMQRFAFALTLSDATATTLYGFCLRVPPPKPPSPSTATPYPHVMCVLSHHKWPSVFFEMLTMVEENVYGSSFLEVRNSGNDTRKEPCSESLKACDHFLAQLITLPLCNLPDALKPPPSRVELSSIAPIIRCLPLPTLIFVFAALLNERRVVFTSSSISRLSACVFAALQLLTPFKWQHVCVPLLPPNLLSHVCAPMPFVQGMHKSIVDGIKNLPTEEVLVVNLDGGTISANYDPKKTDGDMRSVPKRLLSKLRMEVQASVTKNTVDNDGVMKAFLRFFLAVFGRYRLYFKAEVAGQPKFDFEGFLADQSRDLRPFCQKFAHTQMFHHWIRSQEKKVADQADPENEFEAAALRAMEESRAHRKVTQAKSYMNWVGEGLKLSKMKQKMDKTKDSAMRASSDLWEGISALDANQIPRTKSLTSESDTRAHATPSPVDHKTRNAADELYQVMRDNAKRDNKRRVTVSEVQSHVRNHSTSTALPVHVDQSIDEKKPVSMEKLICIDDDETVGMSSKEEAPIAASLSQAWGKRELTKGRTWSDFSANQLLGGLVEGDLDGVDVSSLPLALSDSTASSPRTSMSPSPSPSPGIQDSSTTALGCGDIFDLFDITPPATSQPKNDFLSFDDTAGQRQKRDQAGDIMMHFPTSDSGLIPEDWTVSSPRNQMPMAQTTILNQAESTQAPSVSASPWISAPPEQAKIVDFLNFPSVPQTTQGNNAPAVSSQLQPLHPSQSITRGRSLSEAMNSSSSDELLTVRLQASPSGSFNAYGQSPKQMRQPQPIQSSDGLLAVRLQASPSNSINACGQNQPQAMQPAALQPPQLQGGDAGSSQSRSGLSTSLSFSAFSRRTEPASLSYYGLKSSNAAPAVSSISYSNSSDSLLDASSRSNMNNPSSRVGPRKSTPDSGTGHTLMREMFP